MECQAEVQASAPEIDHETIVKSLQRLLTQLAAPNQDPDVPLSFPTTREDLDSLLAICGEIESGADRLVAENAKKRNSFLPFHQLPAGVVVKILHAALSAENYAWTGHKHTFLHRQKKLRSVCTRWNQIILDTPTFWATVSCADVHERRLQAALRLSKDAPLEIVCRSGGKLTSKFHCRPFAAEMSEVAHRWGSLDIKEDYWTEYLSLPTPELTSLTVQCGDEPGADHTWTSPFLGGAGPKLRKISLRFFAPPWDDFPAFSSLERLEIRCVSRGPSVAQVVEILSRCKHLLEFTLYQARVQPLPGAIWSAERARIECPSLRMLHFETVRLDSVVQILNSLQPPGKCKIRIIGRNHEAAYGPFLDFVRHRIPELDTDGDAANTVCVDLEGTPVIGLAFPRHLWKLHFSLSDPKWIVDRAKWDDCAKILKDIRSAFGNMEEEDPGVNLWILRRQVKRAFKLVQDTYPKLTRLCTVTEPDTLSLLCKPQPLDRDGKDNATTEESGAEEPTEWLFPNLEDVHLYSRPDTTGLLEFVEARRNNPKVKPITKLVVDNSTTPEEVREKLKEYVADLRFRVI
ncbi:hypothetical protein FRC04_007682 [Tulasnella sp. 424]|nr:hypothetical protein FRC04_007682 [Tulasnella sp. 424]KAG8979112.1 hypothetical protein FRC05_009322 [Tulasnella sp. 425]